MTRAHQSSQPAPSGSEAPRNKQMTAATRDVQGGFTGPPIAENKTGKRRGRTIETAVLGDRPGDVDPGRYLFVTSARADAVERWRTWLAEQDETDAT